MRSKQQGFTLLEVMMALTVLAIGMVGIVALQAATIGSTQDASQFTTANAVARTWIQRLNRDAQRWNHPSKKIPTDDIGDTAWLQFADTRANVWFRPDANVLEQGASPAFDRNGNDISLADADGMRDDAVYCTHIRLRRLYPETIRAEVRVFWKKRHLGAGATYMGYGLAAGICSTTDNVGDLEKDTANFHWAYTVAGIARVTAQ